jgi:uncharacterized membrane protein
VTHTFVVVTFDDMDKADQMLKIMKDLEHERKLTLDDAAILVKNEEGELRVKDLGEFTAKRGAVTGGVAGLVVGTILGGPIGGVILGAAAGAFAGNKMDLGISNDKIEAVGESMEQAGSAFFAKIEAADMELLTIVLKQSGGTLHELTVDDETVLDLENVMLKGDIR